MVRQKSVAELGRLDAEAALKSQRLGLTLVLEDIRSGNNVGSLFRTADAFGLAELILVGITPLPPHREILKASLGAEATVPWRAFERIEDALATLRMEGLSIWALEQAEPSILLHEMSFAERLPMAVVLGNEVRGVSPEALALCDGAIEIAQAGFKHSLNVSVAAGVLGWAVRHG